MSASRICLLAAATVGGALMPTATCWAQAYGAKAIVEHNDLRWFEPIELDLDGQMPRRDSGYFGRFEKLNWSYTGERITVGSPDVEVRSEQIYRENPDIITQGQVDILAGALGPQPSLSPVPPDQTELDQIAQVLGVTYTGDFVLVDTGETETVNIGGEDVEQ
ncbi:MAG: hypothetical protein AAF266_11350, partial [Planctomycetota bacterium]